MHRFQNSVSLKYCNYIFIYLVALAKRQRRDLYGFRVELQPAHLCVASTKHSRDFILYLFETSADSQAGKLGISIFVIFDLNRPRLELESTASVAYALSTRQLIGWYYFWTLS